MSAAEATETPPSLRRRPRLFAALLALFSLWILGLIALRLFV